MPGCEVCVKIIDGAEAWRHVGVQRSGHRLINPHKPAGPFR